MARGPDRFPWRSVKSKLGIPGPSGSREFRQLPIGGGRCAQYKRVDHQRGRDFPTEVRTSGMYSIQAENILGMIVSASMVLVGLQVYITVAGGAEGLTFLEMRTSQHHLDISRFHPPLSACRWCGGCQIP